MLGTGAAARAASAEVAAVCARTERGEHPWQGRGKLATLTSRVALIARQVRHRSVRQSESTMTRAFLPPKATRRNRGEDLIEIRRIRGARTSASASGGGAQGRSDGELADRFPRKPILQMTKSATPVAPGSRAARVVGSRDACARNRCCTQPHPQEPRADRELGQLEFERSHILGRAVYRGRRMISASIVARGGRMRPRTRLRRWGRGFGRRSLRRRRFRRRGPSSKIQGLLKCKRAAQPNRYRSSPGASARLGARQRAPLALTAWAGTAEQLTPGEGPEINRRPMIVPGAAVRGAGGLTRAKAAGVPNRSREPSRRSAYQLVSQRWRAGSGSPGVRFGATWYIGPSTPRSPTTSARARLRESPGLAPRSGRVRARRSWSRCA